MLGKPPSYESRCEVSQSFGLHERGWQSRRSRRCEATPAKISSGLWTEKRVGRSTCSPRCSCLHPDNWGAPELPIWQRSSSSPPIPASSRNLTARQDSQVRGPFEEGTVTAKTTRIPGHRAAWHTLDTEYTSVPLYTYPREPRTCSILVDGQTCHYTLCSLTPVPYRGAKTRVLTRFVAAVN